MDFTPVVKPFLTVLWQFSLLGTLAAFPEISSAADDAAKPVLFAVRTANGSLVRGSWRQLKTDWSVRLGEGDGTSIAGAEVLTVRRLDVPLPPRPGDEHLILVNGDRLPYEKKSLRLAGEKFHFRHAYLEEGREASLQLAAVALLWQTAPDRTLDVEKFRRRLLAATRTRDIICLRNGDIVAGVLAALDQQKAEVEVENKRVVVKMPQVAYIAFNTELADTLRPKGVYARLILTKSRHGEGGRLSLTSASCADGATLRGTTVFGARLRVPLDEVAALDVYQGRATYLSDLKPSKYEYRPYLDAAWSFAVDSNILEHDLLLGGSTYDKGIGMHSHSRLTYRLAGAYRRFEALVGLDDKDGRRGSVRIRVLADGAPVDLGPDRELTARSGPLPISIPVEGVRELTLEVHFGDDGDVQDVVDWVDARLVK